jgi:hypothetical protein
MLTALCGMLAPLAAGFLQRFGDLIVGGIVLGLVAFGSQNGLFLAVLAGMHALVSLVVALAFADPLGNLLVSFELPARYAFPAAFGILLCGTALGIRLAVGAYVPSDVVRFAPMIDKVGGGLIGAVAGIIVAGTVLIACSIAPLPEAFRIDGSKLSYDMGTKMLVSFARCVEPNKERQDILLHGEPGTVADPPPAPPADAADQGSAAASGPAAAPAEEHDKHKHPRHGKHQAKGVEAAQDKPPAPPPPPVPHWSEPFADLNGNKAYDEGEPFLDTDGDKAFSHRLKLEDKPGNAKEKGAGNGRRDIGLLERYKMHAWGHLVISVLAPDEILAPPSEFAPAADAAAPPPAQ